MSKNLVSFLYNRQIGKETIHENRIRTFESGIVDDMVKARLAHVEKLMDLYDFYSKNFMGTHNWYDCMKEYDAAYSELFGHVCDLMGDWLLCFERSTYSPVRESDVSSSDVQYDSDSDNISIYSESDDSYGFTDDMPGGISDLYTDNYEVIVIEDSDGEI